MKKFRWQLIIIFLTGLVVGILLLGEQPVAQTFLRPEPVQGGIYTEALIGELQRLNPLLDFYNSADRDVDRLIFSSLIRFDERGLPKSDLAESWGISKDGTIYNFTLREGIVWHDNLPLTSDDVIFTIELLREGGVTVPEDVQLFWQDVEVKRLNEQNLQFQLPEPFAPFLDYLSFGILPEHLFGDLSFEQMVNSPYNLQPVGSGPFRYDHLIVEEGEITGIVLVSSVDYYGKVPYIDQVIFRYYPDAENALQAYQEGLVQGISEVSVDVLPGVLSESGLALYTVRKPEIAMILLNLDNPEVPFFSDPIVRRALLLGTNRQWMIDHILEGQAIISDLPILPGTWAYYDGIPQLDYEPEQANVMLKEAGYQVSGDTESVRMMDDIPFEVTLLYPEDKHGYSELAEAIQKNWSRLSIQVILEGVPYEELVNERLDAREYQAALVDLNLARSPDPDPYPFWSQVQAIAGQNYSQWDHRMASEYLEQARVTNDLTERARLYNNFQAVFSQELPALPMFYPVYAFAVDYQVQGIRVGPVFDSSDRFAEIQDWFLEARYLSEQSTTTPATETE
jgi:peptide/nickel transport system substrate-binding protein